MLKEKGISPVIGTILIIAVTGAITATVAVTVYGFREKIPTGPSTGAILDFEETSEGMLAKPRNVGSPVILKINGNSITKITKSDVGKEIFLPTSPGDQLLAVTSEGAGNVLMNKEIHQGEAGDFVAYYKFNSGGDNIIDRSGNGNTGEIVGNPIWATTGNDTGLEFDGSNDWVNVSSLSSEFKVSEFTIAVAYRPKKGDKKQELIEHINDDGSNWVMELKDRAPGDNYKLAYSVDKAGGSQTGQFFSPALNAGNRHVAVGTFDGKKYELFIDGESQGIRSFDSEQKVGVGELTIARDAESDRDYLDGIIYEVRLYYTVFDTAKIGILTEAMSSD